MPATAEGAVDEAQIANAFVDTQPGSVPAGVESTEGGEVREGGRRRRRGGRGGRDRDEARTPADGEVATEPGADMQAGLDEGAVNGNQAAQADADGIPAADGAESGERDGRRRSRGGRNRRDRGEGRPDAMGAAEGVADTGTDAEATGTEAPTAAEMTTAPVAVSYTEAAVPEPEVRPTAPAAGPIAFKSLIVPAAVTPIAAEPVAVSAPTPAPAPEPMQAPSPAPAPATTAAAFVLETDSLQAVAETAGLQWVNSDADKIRAAQEAMASEAKPVHVARTAKPVVAIDDGPLVLVETRKDLSQVKLPFETDAGSSTTN